MSAAAPPPREQQGDGEGETAALPGVHETVKEKRPEYKARPPRSKHDRV